MTLPESPDQISELVTKIKLLEEDNLLLAERAEETLLIALIGESINNLDDSDEVINCVLERIAFLKDIPYCACLPLGNDAAEPSHVYATFREKDCAGDRLQLTPALLRTMGNAGYYIHGGELRSGGIDFQVEGADFTPQLVMLIPFSCRAIPRGSFVFADAVLDQKRFESLVMLLQRIVDMTVTKLDIIFLVNDLEELTAALDQKVLARTASLNDVNKKLRKEIKERQRSEDELRRFRLGIERSGDAIFLTDEEGVITYVNPAFEKTYGYANEEVIGQTPRILKSGEHSAADYKSFWETILAKEVVVLEMINKTKDGRLLHMAISANPIVDERDTIVGFLAIQQDITERKKAEISLSKSYHELKLLDEITRAAIGGSTLNQLIEKIVRAFEELCSTQAVTVYSYDKIEHRLRALNISLDKTTVSKLQNLTGIDIRNFAPILRDGYRIAGALKSGQSFVTSDPEEITALYQEFTRSKVLRALIKPAMKLIRVRNIGIIPLVSGEGPVGLISFNTQVELNQEDLERINRFGNEVATLLAKLRTEEVLRDSEERLRLLFDSANDAIMVHRPTPESTPGRFIEVNDVACRRLGYSREEFQQLTPMDISLADEATVKDIMGTLLNEGRVIFETLHKRKDEKKIPVEISSHLFELDGEKAILSIVRDITKRKRAEEALKESEERFRAISQQMPDALFVFDLDDPAIPLKIIECNEVACKMHGYTREELIGQSIALLDDQQTTEKIPERYAKLVAGETLSFIGGHVRKDGSTFPIEITIRLVTIAGKKIGVAIDRDITERKQAEEERESLITELEQKNAEMERFNYTVSHDLKSPLITIKGFTTLLEEELVKEKKQDAARDAMGYINKAVDKMHLLLDDLLELSRVGRLVHPPEEFALGSLVEEVIEQLSGPIDERKVNVEFDLDLLTLFADPIGISQVMQNLIDNAVKFTGDQKKPQVKIGSREKEGEQIIYIQDNGMGIDPQYHDRIFGLFRQLEPSQDGSGVGLTLVKRIIELHGGHIWVESEGLGTGSTFCFTLPQQKASQQEILR